MYHDSDDESVSGDEDVGIRTDPPAVEKFKARSPTAGVRLDSGRNVPLSGATRSPVNNRRKRGGSSPYKGFNLHPVLVVDYDLTLVDRLSRPFPGSHDFIERLRDVNGGRNQLILYSHGSPAYIDDGLTKHYEHERKLFDEIISDSSARENKPVTYVRRVIKRTDHLIGPYVIIDDMRSNLDGDQYDVVIDITRLTGYDDRGTAVSVDYDTCLQTVDRGIRTFLSTKRKSTTPQR